MYASWLGECLPPPASKYVSARLLTHSESPTHSLACLPAAELAAHCDALGDGGYARVVELESHCDRPMGRTYGLGTPGVWLRVSGQQLRWLG